MKRIAIISAIVLSSLFYNSANAQIRLSFGIRLAPRPAYVPARLVVQQPVDYCEPTNYDGDEDYYYLPEVDAYYSVPERCYYYNDGGQWISAAYLPGAYRDYDWRSARRYEVHAPRPYMHNDYYRTRFNGVSFNGHWDRGYANVYRYNHDQYKRDDYRFDNGRGWNDNNRQYNQKRDQRFDNNRGQDNRWSDQGRDRNMGSAQQHFSQRDERGDRGNHRQGRF